MVSRPVIRPEGHMFAYCILEGVIFGALLFVLRLVPRMVRRALGRM